MEELKNQPKEKVGDIVQGFVEDGKAKITVTKQNDGLFTIRAT